MFSYASLGIFFKSKIDLQKGLELRQVWLELQQLEPCFFSLYLFTFWKIGSIKIMQNYLLAVPVCCVLMPVQTTVTRLL